MVAINHRLVKKTNNLQGKTIAFEENFSTSGYMLPYLYLKEQGLNLTEKTSNTQFISDSEIGYIFSGSDNNSLQWLISGRVAAAAMGSVDFEQLPEETRQQFIIIAETKSVPRHLFLMNAKLVLLLIV